MSDLQRQRLLRQPIEAIAVPNALSTRYKGCSFSPMQADDLMQIEAIERQVYEHPWSLGNFKDSLSSGYQCWLVRDALGTLAGYYLLMLAPDEGHLLNVTVFTTFQSQGLGRQLLEHAIGTSRDHGASAVLLEVRPSNQRAIAIYQHVGFKQIGIRKRYYPALAQQREDAIVMRLEVAVGAVPEPVPGL